MSKHQILQQSDWLAHVKTLRGELQAETLGQALACYEQSSTPLLTHGLGVADILLSLGLDTEALAAAIIYPGYRDHLISLEAILEHFGESTAKLVQDTVQMQALGGLRNVHKRESHQLEQLRKMFLAMVTDVRAVLIVLSERVWLLRQARHDTPEKQHILAEEVLNVFAPLANRLGIWQLKWELEDYCLRYLHPDIYKTLAKGIATKRDEREKYIESFKAQLIETLQHGGINNFQVTGRVKHIYSIYKKMQRKNASLETIYDMTALRVLTDNIENCYAVLGILQEHWEQIPEEFDDYIASPKQNGYQSIHVVLIGPNHHNIEVQIRTYQMHQASELGVAAHWRYKEGVLETSTYESKIALLRQVMAWQRELSQQDETSIEKPIADLFADRVYVFTPLGDIIDLPTGSTPIDFAYTVHSEVGHRCRGAKVDGHIVPLTYQLQTGQRIEVLTAKQPNPSRDWLNPQLGYIKSARTRAKIQHWFKVKDSVHAAVNYRDVLEKECKKLGVPSKLAMETAAAKLRYKSIDDLLSALSSGELRLTQVVSQLLPRIKEDKPVIISETKLEAQPVNIQILGIDQLLTHTARCCKPLPGDPVLGYITRHHGVSIHRQDCLNLQEMVKNGPDKVLDVTWGGQLESAYPADILIHACDRAGLLRDITSLLVADKYEIAGLQTQKMDNSDEVDIYVTIKVTNKLQLDHAVKSLATIPNVLTVTRR